VPPSAVFSEKRIRDVVKYGDAISLPMPTHSVEFGSRELILLMELVSEATEEGRYHYADESALRRMHRKAEMALGFEGGSAVGEEEESQTDPNGNPDSEELRDSEICYRGPSLDDLLGESEENNFR
jgi:hypothetical protein